METEEGSDEIELKSYITDDLHIVPEIVDGIHSADREVRLAATVKVRRLVQKLVDMARQPVINSGLLETVVGMLSSSDLESSAEAAWILNNVACGTPEQAYAVVAAGAVPKLVALLPCESTDVILNALWALGNIGLQSQHLRDSVVREGGVKPVLDVLDTPEKHEPKVVDIAAWTLACYLDPIRKQKLGYEVTRHMIPALIKFIQNTTDETSEALKDVVESLDRISFNETAAEAIIATGITPRLVELCVAKNDNLRYHAVHCLGEFVSGSEASTEAPIQAGFLRVMKSCIEFIRTRETACWAASNIAAGSLSQAQALFDNDLIPSIFQVISNQEEQTKARHDAVWVLLNLTKKVKEHNGLLVRLAQANCMEAFALGLSSPHYQTLRELIRGLENIVNAQWSGQEQALERFKVAGGARRLAAIRYGPKTCDTALSTSNNIISFKYSPSAQASSQLLTFDSHTMENTAESTPHSPCDDEIESLEDYDGEMETDEDSDEIELKSYITDDLHIVSEIVSGIHSADREVRLAATVKVRRLTQDLIELARQPVINSGLLEPIVGMLSSDDLKLCAEAAWILANVTSGTSEQTTAVVAAGAIPKLVALFPSESTDVLDNALGVLGNIGGDSQHLRDLVVQEGGVKPVLDVLDTPENHEPKVVDTAAWALSFYLDSRKEQKLGYEVHMIPVLIKFIQNTTDETLEAFTDVLRSLDRISFNETAAEAIIATGITSRLVELCAAKNDNLRYHAVHCLGEFTSGSEASTEAPIEAGFLRVMKSCIESEHVGTRQMACWAASNIAAGSLSQAQALFDNDLIPSIFQVISNQEEETETRYDAVWVLFNLADKGRKHNELLVRLVQGNCMEAISIGLSSFHHMTLHNLIRALEYITSTQWSGQEEALERFKVAGGASRLASIRYGPETPVRRMAKIIPGIISGIHSTDREVRLAATVKVRRLLQKLQPEEGAQPVIDSGLIEPVIGMLSSNDLEFRAEAAWILTNIASGTSEQTAAVRSRDVVVQAGGVKPVLDTLDTPMVETASWTLTSDLNPKRDEDLGYGMFKHLETFTKVLKALDYISADDTATEAILATGLALRLVELCTAKDDNVQYHAIRCVGQFTVGSEASTGAAIQAGLLAALRSCIPSEHVGTRQNACWAASNIAAGSLAQAQALFDNDLIPLILRVISNQEEERRPRHEASWALYTLVDKGQEHHDLLVRLVQEDCMEALASGLSSPDYPTLSILIHGLEKIAGKQWNGQEDALERFKVAGRVGRLVALRDEPETRGTFVGRTALGLLRTHFQEFVKRPRV
ncbi:hypothetical protein M407DRAFT_25129 [Tulasnella calospora MUT 4182]|uniref:Uncharacterized protein n=1 Tax=Tulasnella calospora MUT 4182 TaxID=1051891 RepID=A0A0C3LVX3_9AGAM|nr:hypothetical protein M407DRAFT_25129 [Tulasnella calospora MUT 4182]